ncbi:LytR C-terminal domain-containing protein [Arthrobacter sp. H14-L1]|uniref:LytR C-terminal domain-containing protein n=1 Tax=Arthrobacter sp. H14-L1 TaxID=2996697 RepID=UPI00226F5298|nr:LytR C-terminal domain-containing protein [Arthrobacter sp. H14-L1]MCY0906116.1 LytR C-terminal domain-containing protein [Arthrobacter sp. H14-L1]
MSKYPRDEFDKVPENSSRRGVHRSFNDAPRSGLVPILAFAVLALLIGAVAFFVLPTLGFGPSSSTVTSPAPSSTASSTATASPAPSSSAPSSSAGTSRPAAAPSAKTSPSGLATASPTPSPEAAGVNKTTPVSVLNASGVVGLAAKYGSMVTDAGWPVSQTGNWAGAAQPSSVIFYSSADDAADAEALGQLLGIRRTVQTFELQVPLAVVLGPGAQ